MPKSSSSAGPSHPPIYTRLGIPTRRPPPRSPPSSSLTRRVILYDCQTPGHIIHTYIFETHLNGAPIPIDPSGDAERLAAVRVPRCPLPARQRVMRQVSGLRGPAELFGAPARSPPPADMDEGEEMEWCTSRIERVQAQLDETNARLAALPDSDPGHFPLASEAFWHSHALTSLQARMHSLASRRTHAPFLAALDSAHTPGSAITLLRQVLAIPVSSHAERRSVDYIAALVMGHIAVLTLEAIARQARALGADMDEQAVKVEMQEMALLRLAVGALLQADAFWVPERSESMVTMRRWLERWGRAAGEDVLGETTPKPTTAADIKPLANEHLLSLPGGRQLAYADLGPTSSRTVVLFFSGLFSIGTATDMPPIFERLGAHFLAPTPTGMGLTSPRPPGVAYHTNLINDMNALLESTHPDGIDALYVGGGSYGATMAQMLYGAPYSLFPWGRQIKGVLLMAGFSPFKYHESYASSLAWPNWVSVGPPSRMPFRLFQRLFSLAVAGKFKSVEGAKTFLASTLFDKMDPAERGVMDAWLQSKGKTFHEFVRGMAENNVRSVAKTWDGFMEVSDVLHSDWGFDPRKLDSEHAKPVLVVGGEADTIGGATNQWIVDNYPNATMRSVPGGHIAGLFYMDEVWEQLWEMGEGRAGRAAQTAQ